MSSIARAEDFLPPEQAFRVTAAAASDRSVVLNFTIAPGYYLYHESIKVEAKAAQLGPVIVPKGKVKFDENFGREVETHRGQLVLNVPLVAAPPPSWTVRVQLQGCADAGLCYPPMSVDLHPSITPDVGVGERPSDAQGTPVQVEGATAVQVNWRRLLDGQLVDDVLTARRLVWIAPVFFVLGVLLSLTPCVLPMLPILSSLIVGSDAETGRARSFGLAAAYVMGMASVYTGLGVAAGAAGEGLGLLLQTPWALGAFAVLLVGLALSMFDVYELRPPAVFTAWVSAGANRLPAGQWLGVCAMGGLSALIVSPCVTGPMAGALLFISRTGDLLLGAVALFSLALGMGLPLLLLGASAGRWLPRSGPWMFGVKRLFGMLLFGVALWTVQPVLPVSATLALWGLLFMATGLLLRPWWRGASHHHVLRRAISRAAALAALVWGAVLVVGAATGGDDLLQPLGHWRASQRAVAGGAELHFETVRSPEALDRALRNAQGRVVVLDFYADWCVSCKEMERFTYREPSVQALMQQAVLLKADVTRSDEDARALLRRYRLFGPPATLFFSADGVELARPRVAGYQSARQFAQTLREAGL